MVATRRLPRDPSTFPEAVMGRGWPGTRGPRVLTGAQAHLAVRRAGVSLSRDSVATRAPQGGGSRWPQAAPAPGAVCPERPRPVRVAGYLMRPLPSHNFPPSFHA